MATDWVDLFDLELAKRLVRLDRPALARFVAAQGPGLAERDRREAREKHAALVASLRSAARRAGPEASLDEAERDLARLGDRLADRMGGRWQEFGERLADGHEDLPALRAEIAWAAGSLTRSLRVDYWGCFAEVLSPVIGRSCETNLVLDPDDPDGEHVYFLLAPHVNAMIASLRAHWSEVTVMNEAGLKRLVELRDRCAAGPGLRVAYHIDL